MRVLKISKYSLFVWDMPMYDMPGFHIRIFGFGLHYSFKGQVNHYEGRYIIRFGKNMYSPKKGWTKVGQ